MTTIIKLFLLLSFTTLCACTDYGEIVKDMHEDLINPSKTVLPDTTAEDK